MNKLPEKLSYEKILQCAKKAQKDFGQFVHHDQYQNPTFNKMAIDEFAQLIEYEKEMQFLSAIPPGYKLVPL